LLVKKVVGYGDPGVQLGVGVTMSGHPALSEGVVAQDEGWGIYAFWVPPREDALGLIAELHEGWCSLPLR
jgi:hypothetical protein